MSKRRHFFLQSGSRVDSDNVIVQQGGQELIVLLTGNVGREGGLGSVKLGRGVLGAQLLADLVDFFVEELEQVLRGDGLTFGGLGLVASPLPELRTRDFSSSSILHLWKVHVSTQQAANRERHMTRTYQVVDRNATDTTEPSFHVLQTNGKVVTNTSFSDRTRGNSNEVVRVDTDVVAAHVDLVGLRHVLVEHGHSDRNKIRMSDPSTVYQEEEMMISTSQRLLWY